MTPEKQRIAIAEACGVSPVKRWRVWWTADRQHGVISLKTKADALHEIEKALTGWGSDFINREEVSEPEEYDNWEYAPDYLEDLNAMHEAEKVLTGKQWDEYCKRVDDLSRKAARIANWQSINPSYVIDAHQIHADADIKAEAFVRTLGKWEEA